MTKPLQQMSREEAIKELGNLREYLKGNEHLAPRKVPVLEKRIDRSRFQLKLVFTGLAISVAVVAFSSFATYQGKLVALWALVPAALVLIALCFPWYYLRESILEDLANLKDWRAALVRVRASEEHDEENELEVYRIQTESIINELRQKARQNRRLSNVLQIIVIVGSIIVTSLASIGLSLSTVRWANVGVAALVSICAGINGFFKFRERSHGEQRTADAIEKEANHLDLGIGVYSLDRVPALKLFASKIEDLREDQRKAELQLEQSPQAENRSSSVPAGASE